jgi:hypothetical protein
MQLINAKQACSAIVQPLVKGGGQIAVNSAVSCQQELVLMGTLGAVEVDGEAA